MNYLEEADYIDTQDLDNIPKCFNNSLECFHNYCDMQFRSALRAKQYDAANRIATTCERIQAKLDEVTQ